MTWTGTFTNQQCVTGELLLHVNRVRKGHWFWSINKEQFTVGAKGKVRRDVVRVVSGEEGCRKAALNEVVAAGARVEVRLWEGRRRVGRHVRI